MAMTISEAERILADVAALYGASVHGTDSNGIADVEFKNAHAAASFALGLDNITLRDPITGLSDTVVLQMPIVATVLAIQSPYGRKR